MSKRCGLLWLGSRWSRESCAKDKFPGRAVGRRVPEIDLRHAELAGDTQWQVDDVLQSAFAGQGRDQLLSENAKQMSDKFENGLAAPKRDEQQ